MPPVPKEQVANGVALPCSGHVPAAHQPRIVSLPQCSHRRIWAEAAVLGHAMIELALWQCHRSSSSLVPALAP
jgi:hypothetical protein